MWCDVIFFLECPVEVGQVMKTHGQGHIEYGGVPVFKLLNGLFKTQVIDIFNTGHVHMLFEKTHKMIIAEAA